MTTNTQVTKLMQVYADTVKIDPNGTNQVQVTMSGFDITQVVAEFSIVELLEAIEANDGYSDIVDYVSRKEDN